MKRKDWSNGWSFFNSSHHYRESTWKQNPSIQQKITPTIIFVATLFWVTWNRRPKTTPLLWSSNGNDVEVQITADDPNGNIQEVIQAQLDIVNALMSTYQPDSEISRFNRSDTEPFEVSTDTARVIKAALELHQKSNGAFDITIGPVVNAWGFGFPPPSKNPRKRICRR